MTKQAIIYCRFSPRPDAEETKSNALQADRCRAFCAKQGYEVAGVHSDEALTGRIFNRPGLNAALAALAPGMALVVDTGDRLARDMLVTLTVHHQIEQLGAHVEYADGSPPRNTPEGELLQNVLAAFAQYERARYARRTKAGLARKKAEGIWIGRPPLGWQVDRASKRLVPHKQEQCAIKRAHELAQEGRYSSAVIAERLTIELGSCRGKPWGGRAVRKILARKVGA